MPTSQTCCHTGKRPEPWCETAYIYVIDEGCWQHVSRVFDCRHAEFLEHLVVWEVES